MKPYREIEFTTTRIKSAVKALKPINVTQDAHWCLSGTLQRVPYQVWDEPVGSWVSRRFGINYP